MKSIVCFLKIAYYFCLIFMIFFIAKKNYKNKDKFPLIFILLICLLYGIYAIICGAYPYGGDRYNFAFRFMSDYYNGFVHDESLGLFYLEKFLHIFSYDPKILFSTVASLFMFFTLMAYKNIKNVSPYALLLLMLSSYPTFGMYMLKQCLAVSLVFFAYSMFDKNKFICLLSAILAILFHESALIIIPIIIVLKYIDNPVIRRFIYFFTIVTMLLFARYNYIIINLIIKLVPSLEYQLSEYINSNSGVIVSNGTLYTFLKGIPFFVIFFTAFLMKKRIENKIGGYHKYMFLTVFVSISFILSSYMYWIFRVGIYFYLPVFVFAVEIMKEINLNKNKLIYTILTFCLLFVLSFRLWLQYYFIHGGI